MGARRAGSSAAPQPHVWVGRWRDGAQQQQSKDPCPFTPTVPTAVQCQDSVLFRFGNTDPSDNTSVIPSPVAGAYVFILAPSLFLCTSSVSQYWVTSCATSPQRPSAHVTLGMDARRPGDTGHGYVRTYHAEHVVSITPHTLRPSPPMRGMSLTRVASLRVLSMPSK